MNFIICLLPFLVGCGWFAILTSRRNKTLAVKMLSYMALLGGLYFLCDAIGTVASKDFDPDTVVYANLINTLIGPLLSVAAAVFFLSLIKMEQHASQRWMLVIIPFVCYAFATFIVTKGLGIDNAADYLANGKMVPAFCSEETRLAYAAFDFMISEVFRWLMVFEFSVLSAIILYCLLKSDFKPKVIFRFLFKGGPMRPMHVVAIFFVILMAQSYYRFSNTGAFAMHDPSLATIIYIHKAATLFFIGLFGYHCQKPAIYLINKHTTPHFDDLPILKAKSDWREESMEDEYQLPALQNDFYHLMHEQQCYRRPGLNIYSVASELGVTANSLNHMVKAVYGVNYNTYVKVQRVAFARRYHKVHEELPIETVAMESGFRSADVMRQHFKEASYVIQKTEN